MFTLKTRAASITLSVLAAAAAAASLAATPTSKPSNPDQAFMVTAAQDGLKEVSLGRLAASQADAAPVRDFGRMMVADHATANDQLLTIAMQENVSPPQGLSTEGQATYDKLSATHGPGFDRAYVQAMLDDHQQDIAEYQKEVDHGTDTAVKDWARNTLPILRRHLEAVQALNATLGK